MANGTRDVSLVIRAKNEASRTLDTIASSLDTLRNSQNKVGDSSQKTGDLLTQLGTELGKLRSQVGGANTMERLAGSLDKAATSVGRLEAATAELSQEQQRLQSELQSSEATATRLATRHQQLSDRLAHQQRVTQQARQSHSELTREVQQAERALAGSGQQSQRFIDKLTRQDAALERTKVQYRQLAQQIAATEQPSNRLLDRFEQVERRLSQQSGAFSRVNEDYRQHLDSVERTRAALPRLQAAQEQASAAFDRAQAAQRKTSTALGYVSTATLSTERALRQTQTALDRNAASFDRQNASLDKARQELTGVEQAAEQAGVALDQVGRTVRQRLLGTLRDSQNELARYKREWQSAQQAISQAVRGGDSTADPSPELQRQLQIARQQKQAYDDTRVAVQQMRTAIRSAGTDVNQLAAAQQTYQQALARIRTQSAQATTTTKQKTEAHRQDTAAVRQNADAMRELERQGRAAMTWAQRLRGEVIALTLSYVGLYAAIEQLRGVTRAFMELEAAQTRMNVAFQGNDAISGREMRWVREEADKLGIQFGILAGEYSKFAIASRGTSLEGAEARRIFESVTTAARVNKLSIDQIQGTFLALTQILSKGTVSMEELRQQMGERLYGAFNLAADAMGLTTEELNKLVSTGQLASERFLPRFATELEKVFGPQLGDALDTFTTDLGRFQNEIFKTQLRVAEAGFIDGLRDALISLTEFLQSDDGVRFFETLGAAAGNTVRILAEIPRYFEEILFVITAMVGVRLVPWLGALRGRFADAVAAARPLPATLNATGTAAQNAAGGINASNRAAAATVPVMTQVQTALRRTNTLLTTTRGRAIAARQAMVGMRAAMAMVGGVPGLIITGVSLALTAWMTRTRDVVDVTAEHEQQMQRLLDQYSRVAEEAGDWTQTVADGLDGITLDQVRQNFRKQLDAMRSDAQSAFTEIGGRISAESVTIGGLVSNQRDPALMELQRLSRAMRDGTIRAGEYQKALNDILAGDNVSDRVRTLIEDSADLTQSLVDQEERVLESAAAVQELGGSLEELPSILAGAVPSLNELADAAGLLSERVDPDPLVQLNRQVEALRGKIPSLTDEMKMMEELTAIDQILDTASAIEGIDKTSAAFQRFLGLVQQAKDEIRDAFDARRFQAAAQAIGTPGASSAELSANLIRQREGYRETPYYDVNAFRAGFGSDTVTLADGSVQAVTEGMRVSVADANRDLMRRIGEFQSVVRRQVGEQAWAAMNPQQQAVLTSNAYNYGSLQDRLVEAVRSGNQAAIQAVLRAQGDDNQGVNRERRQQEAFLFGQADTINAEATLRYVEDQLKEHEQLVERAAEYNDQLDRTLARRAEDLQYVDGLTKEMAVARALEDERLNAQRIGVTLSQQQLSLIRQNAATAWEQEAAEQRAKEAKERQAEVDRELNLLVQQRRDLLEQIEFFQDRGDADAAQRLREQFDAVTVSVREAIDAQIEFWKAARGGEDSAEADAAIVRLQNLRNSLLETNQTAILTSRSMGLAFGEQLKAGADSFIQRIRETGDVFQSLRLSFQQFAMEFLTQIAQMALRQLMLNGLMAAFNALTGGAASAGGGGGFIQGVLAGVSHDGGVAGSSNRSRTVSPGLFANAARYHTGGIAGLKANEVPAVLERGEEVLTETDPRHRDNLSGGNADAPPRGLSVVLVQDQTDIVSAMQSSAGDQVILQYLKNNRRTVKQLIS